MSVELPESRNSLVGAGTQVEQFGSKAKSTRPEQEKREEVRVINLESVLLGTDEIYIKYTWVQGGNPDASYTLPLSKVQKMVESGVCISSEGSNYSQGSNVEENLNRLLEFIKRQEDSLKNTASALSVSDSKNSTEVAGVPDVSTGPETDAVAAQTQTDSSEQKPDSGERFKSRINETLIAGLKNEKYNEGLDSIERFITSDEFRSLSVSPAEYIKIADAILEIVNRGIQSEGLKLFNYFLMMKYPACFDILDKAIGMGSTQTPEALKEGLTDLFIRIRDQVVKFGDLVAKTKDKSLFRHTLSEIIGQDKLHFLKLIYPRITRGRSQVDGIIQQVFAGPFGEWVKANTIRINAIATAGLEQVDENKIARDLERLKQLKKSNERGLRLSPRESDEYYSIKSRYNVHLKEALSYRRSILLRYKEDLSRNGPGVNEILTESDEILRIIGSLINNVDQIINLRIPTYL